MEYLERQEDEVEFLQCVFMNDFEDLRNKDPWKIKRPPEIELFLTPQKSMGTSIKQRIQISVKLHAKYTTDYPDTSPELLLVDPHCLSEDLVKTLLKEIKQLANEKLGEVMMLEIVQHVQEFLHKHDLPPVSLHEEMIKRRKREAEEERQRLQQERLRLEEEQIRLEQELLERKSGNSLGDSSGSEEDTSSIDQSSARIESPQRGLMEPSERKKVNIIRGRLLGISSCGGYSVYSGMDCEEGDIIIIYKWNIPCKTATTRTKRMKQIASIRQEFEHFLEKDFVHLNLVQYIEMRHEVNDANIIVEVVCECIKGGNLRELLCNPNTGCFSGQTLQQYSRQLLEALNYLHTRGIVHNDLRPSLVFVDSVKGSIKLCGYTIIKRLSDLVNPISRSDEGVSWPSGLMDARGGKKQDILKLGMVILCMLTGNPNIAYPPVLPTYLPEQTQDFLNKCLEENEYKRHLSHDLLTHPFVTPSPLLNNFVKLTTCIKEDLPRIPQLQHTTNGYESSVFQSSDFIVGSLSDSRLFCNTRSRLGTDFDEMDTLGSGGFGDVIKVKNRLDGRFYAIKKIKLAGGTKMMNKLTREVELLSQMNHENIVRYYNAWIESFPDPTDSTDCDTDYDDDSDSASSTDDDESDDDDDDDDSEIEDSLVIDFHSETDSKTEPDSDNEEEVFEFSAGFSSGDFSNEHLLIGTQQMEANIMDISPRIFRRSQTESSEGIVFQESSSTPTLPPSTINEDSKEEPVKEKNSKRRGPGQIQYLYIQMEYCSNQTVRQLIDTGQLHKSHGQLEWQLFREIVEGLAHIHAQGMIHRDLKPGNIFLNSSGHIKIGDFGLAISFNKHPAFSRQNSIASTNPSAVLAGDTGLVGTALYLAPELLTKHILKYSLKVDIYSLGIIFFEMCHRPVSTLMERAKILADIRKNEIKFPDTFDQDRMNKHALVIKWLLNHNPQERPTSKELLQSSLVPYKIVDEELQEVFTRTLQNPNSSRYRRLIDELFSQRNPKLMELNFFVDPKGQDSKKGLDKIKQSYSYTFGLLRDHIRSTATNVFAKHCALNLQTPLLGPSYQTLDSPFTTRLMDASGKILSLPNNHWISFARHIYHQNISSLKRYDFSKMFVLPKRLGTHPKEIDEYAFDIATPSSKLLAAAEVIIVVLELLSGLSLIQQGVQFTLWLNHTSLTTAILNYCSISSDHHQIVLQYLHKVSNNQMKLADLEKALRDKHNIQLSILATKTLLKLMDTEIPLTEVDSTLQLLIRCRSSVSTLAKQALQDIRQLLKQLGVVQVKVCIYPGMILNPEFFDGIIFQFIQHDLTQTKKKKKKHTTPMAVGGQYDKLVDNFRKTSKVTREPFGGGRDASPAHSSSPSSSVIVFGVSIREEILLSAVANQFVTNQSTFQISNCHALICWLGRDSLHSERNELVKDLRERGLCVDTLYDNLMTLEEIQEYCRRRYIPHIVFLERSLWIKQLMTVRTLESGRGMDKVAMEKTIGKNELFDYLQTKHGIEKIDYTDSVTTANVGSKPSTSGSDVSTGGSLPSISITTLGRQKLQGNMRRRLDSQTLSKLLPLLQTYSPKYAVEIIVVDFELEPLCLFAAEVNKSLGRGKTDLFNVIKILNESDNSLGKKYVTKVCESIQEKITEKSSVIILYSYVIERYQIIVNNSILITNNNS